MPFTREAKANSGSNAYNAHYQLRDALWWISGVLEVRLRLVLAQEYLNWHVANVAFRAVTSSAIVSGQ
jgi:hypothetical protein